MARATAGRAIAGYLRKYPFAPRYGREQALSLVTEDGVRLSGARLAGPADAPCTVVLVHGFVNWSRTPRVHAFAHLLARHVHVVVPDLRGHGRSKGESTLGFSEPLDVAAAVAAADPDLPVVTVGVSLGGAAVLLHAGAAASVPAADLQPAQRRVDGVVAISAPAWWGVAESPGTKKLVAYLGSRFGRIVLARLLRTRVAASCAAVPDAGDVVAAIAPAFTLVVHDPEDWYFGSEHAERLFSWAGEPKDLWWLPGAGHGTDLLTPELADRLLAHVARQLAAVGHH